MKNYQTIREIVEQLSMSEYECEGGFLKMNIAFERLNRIADLNYQPKFQLNEKIVYNGKEYYIRGMMTASSSHPNPEIEYILSVEHQRPSTTNKTDVGWVNEREILTIEEWKQIKIAEAKKLLIDNGIINA